MRRHAARRRLRRARVTARGVGEGRRRRGWGHTGGTTTRWIPTWARHAHGTATRRRHVVMRRYLLRRPRALRATPLLLRPRRRLATRGPLLRWLLLLRRRRSLVVHGRRCAPGGALRLTVPAGWAAVARLRRVATAAGCTRVPRHDELLGHTECNTLV